MTDLVQKGRALILRTCDADMSSYGGFVWPESGPVECPDWKPTRKFGNGLHGALNGEGDGLFLSFEPDAKWLVAEIEEWIDLGGKVKFPRANVLHRGDQKSATDFIIANGATGAVIGASVTAGNRGTATAGYRGTATAGDGGTAITGNRGTAIAGYRGTATAGRWGTATAGNDGTATAGYRGTATAGEEGTATAGEEGTATAGDWGTAITGDWGTAITGDWGTASAGKDGTATAGGGGTAIAGYRGTATAGYRGIATAGYRGIATAGYRGILQIKWHDGSRYRIATAYVCENGIKPNTPYKLTSDGEFVEVEQ